MDSKLTLNVDKTVASRAKAYARSKGRSLSDLVEDFFRYIIRTGDQKTPEFPAEVKSLMGSLKVPEDFDYKKELGERLSEKFLNE